MKIVASFACALLLSGAALAQAAPAASSGVYSKAQAARGKAAYGDVCSGCHGDALEGADVIPPLTGTRFMSNWKGQTAGDLATRIRTTMPADNPGSLGQTASAEITAYLLEANGYPAGEADLPSGNSALAQIPLDAPR
jgi:quinoprotein glucose dehydrogenase